MVEVQGRTWDSRQALKTRFGEFELDTEARWLLRAGRPVHLTPKALALLEYLVARRPTALAKARILERLWSTTFVSEASREFRMLWQRREVSLGEGDNILGRSDAAALSVDHSSVSRRHAVIHILAGRAVLKDCGSKNGTFLGGERITTPGS